MPMMNGIQATAQIRALTDDCKNTAIIAITAHGEQYKESALAASRLTSNDSMLCSSNTWRDVKIRPKEHCGCANRVLNSLPFPLFTTRLAFFVYESLARRIIAFARSGGGRIPFSSCGSNRRRNAPFLRWSRIVIKPREYRINPLLSQNASSAIFTRSSLRAVFAAAMGAGRRAQQPQIVERD